MAVANNFVDPGSNRALVIGMMTMSELRADPMLGNGLEGRAWPARQAAATLTGVMAFQAVLALMFWRAALLMAFTLFRPEAEAAIKSARAANQALIGLLVLIFAFLTGGMWFGYWMKMGPVQAVHLSLLMIALLALLLVNLPQAERRSD
jgi:uncharacterized membrane protein